MFPIRDHNPSSRVPVVTYALIVLNVVVFAATAPYLNDLRFMADWALIPALSAPSTFLTSQFLHGGLLHLAGNMLFLWIFGDNLEDRMGALPFLGFYLLSGVAAGLGQAASEPSSTIPMVGASGAIAGVMGGYLLLFPRARVDVLIILIVFFRVFPIPAWVVLGIWFTMQVVSGTATPGGVGGVAYWAHAGGFAAGLLLTIPVWLSLGGPAFWSRTRGQPPHPQATYPLRRSTVPRAGRRR